MSHPVIVSLDKLLSNKITDNQLVEAFGPNSLGIIIVTDLPDNYKQLRARVLQNAYKLAHLPSDILAKYELPEAFWLVGWSCGKEKLANGQADNYKGSYYVNCDFYDGKSPEIQPQRQPFTPEDLAQSKEYTTGNIWVDDGIIPRFEQDLKDLLKLMIDIASVVAKSCDRYLVNHSHSKANGGYLESIVRNSNTTKARLLHYYATNNDASDIDDSWCGEHVDHSCVTALTSEYLIEKGVVENEVHLSSEQSSKAGLFIRDRNGNAIKVDIPKDALGFQTGSALEAISGGIFRAIPHYVKATSASNISRSTLAVFCQPSLHDKVTEEDDFVSFSRKILTKNH